MDSELCFVEPYPLLDSRCAGGRYTHSCDAPLELGVRRYCRRLGKKGKSVAVPDDPSRTLWGVGLLIFLINVIGMVIAAAVLSIHAPSAVP